MENFIKKNQAEKQLGIGILIVVIGSVFLLRNVGLDIPHWILRWHTIMLAAGLWIGYHKNYRGGTWITLTIIGAIFTLKQLVVFDFEISRITTALVLIGLGLYVILKPKKVNDFENFGQEKKADFKDFNS